MKVTVNTNLNIRVGNPSVNAPCFSYLKPGDQIEYESIVKGDPYEGNNLWLKGTDGNYYWSGGTSIQNFDYAQIISHLNIDWINSKGKNTTIIVIDSGVAIDKIHFTPNIVTEIDLTDGNYIERDHGTFICGITSGNGGYIQGISYAANLISVRYKDAHTKLEKMLDNINEALRKIKFLKEADKDLQIVVNISQGFNKYQCSLYPHKIDEIQDSIKELFSLGVILITAAGENRDLTDNNLLFPTLLKETIAVGCISQGYNSYPLSKNIDIITPLTKLNSYDSKFNIIQNEGSSFSTAIITSIVSLILSRNENLGEGNISKQTILNKLIPFQTNISDFDFDSCSEFYFFITQ